MNEKKHKERQIRSIILMTMASLFLLIFPLFSGPYYGHIFILVFLMLPLPWGTVSFILLDWGPSAM